MLPPIDWPTTEPNTPPNAPPIPASVLPPAKTLPRPKNVFVDFLDAVRAGKKETAVSFEYGTQLTEFALLGNLAMKAGANKKVEWDGKNMKVTNIPELNAWVKRPYRDGWKV